MKTAFNDCNKLGPVAMIISGSALQSLRPAAEKKRLLKAKETQPPAPHNQLQHHE